MKRFKQAAMTVTWLSILLCGCARPADPAAPQTIDSPSSTTAETVWTGQNVSVSAGCANESITDLAHDAESTMGFSLVTGTLTFEGAITKLVRDPPIGANQGGTLSYTQVEVAVDNVLVGPPVGPSVDAWILGGTSGDVRTEVGEASSASWAPDGKVFASIQLIPSVGMVVESTPITAEGQVADVSLGCWSGLFDKLDMATANVATIYFDGKRVVDEDRTGRVMDIEKLKTYLG